MYKNKLKFENLFKDKEKAVNQSSAFVSTKTCSCCRAPIDDGTEINVTQNTSMLKRNEYLILENDKVPLLYFSQMHLNDNPT